MVLRASAAVLSAVVACGLVGYLAFDPFSASEAVPAAQHGAPPNQVARDSGPHEIIASALRSASTRAVRTFDPFNAPTPEAVGASGTPVPLPAAPKSIAKESIGPLGRAAADALLTRPVAGRKTSPFGMRLHPVLGIWKLHTGLDWAAPCGSPVGAAAEGTVVRVGWAGGNGIQVKVDHGMVRGYRLVTTYNHLSSVAVHVGERVDALDGVGRVGSTGYSTGCHLHFEVIVNGQFTDPQPWLNGEPVVIDLSRAEYSEVPAPSPHKSPTPSSEAIRTQRDPSSTASPVTSTPKPGTSSPRQSSAQSSGSGIRSSSRSASPEATPMTSPSGTPTVALTPSIDPIESPESTTPQPPDQDRSGSGHPESHDSPDSSS